MSESSVLLIAKAMMYVCLTFCFCFYVSSCDLEEKVITACENSCKSYNGNMKSVTSSKCICGDAQEIKALPESDLWVLPRR